jgi:hypothetical protein
MQKLFVLIEPAIPVQLSPTELQRAVELKPYRFSGVRVVTRWTWRIFLAIRECWVWWIIQNMFLLCYIIWIYFFYSSSNVWSK